MFVKVNSTKEGFGYARGPNHAYMRNYIKHLNIKYCLSKGFSFKVYCTNVFLLVLIQAIPS